MEEEKIKNCKNIFIVGNPANAHSFAQKLSTYDEVGNIFTAPGNDAMADFCTIIDIREDDVEELLEFSVNNDIDFTIVVSEKAIKNDITSVFQENGQLIFAPTYESANICMSKTAGKKFMYRNHIPCPKFAIFDKLPLAIDYVMNAKMPIVVKTDEHQGSRGTLICNSFSVAKSYIEDLFESGERKILIEDYVLGHEFSFYVVTDGYHSLPLSSVANYKYALDGNKGLITPGMGAYSPDYKITKQIENKLLQQAVYPALNNLARNHTPYVGIFGVDCILSDNKLSVIEFNSFLQIPDCQVILANMNENLYHLIQACIIGSFADDYDYIEMNENSSVACVVSSSKKSCSVINGLDDLDEDTMIAHFDNKKNMDSEYQTTCDRALVLTRSAKTLSRAVETLYDELSVINFDGITYRKDIGK